MSAATDPVDADMLKPEATSTTPHARPRRRMLIIVLVALVAVTVTAVAVTGVFDGHGASGSSGNAAGTSLFTVAKRALSQTTPVSGTLGYSGSYTVAAQLQGTITALPSPGQVVAQGETLYRVDDKPVVLLSGFTPAYRTLNAGVTGPDVAQLNQDLVALGYATGSELDPSSATFTSATTAAVEKLQAHVGGDQSGALDLGQLVFLPTAARVTNVNATLGGPASGTVLSATSTARQVNVALNASLQTHVKQGDKVTITLPDLHTTTGVVASVGTVATAAGSTGQGSTGANTPTIPVTITLDQAADAGALDQAPVQVAITTATVDDALVVPVNSLLALAGGGYAVEVADSRTHHLASVSLGIFDDAAGLVQITNSRLVAGQHVVVPTA
jgi:hypothetical protein